MRLSARKLLGFGAKLLAVLIIFAIVWHYFAPTYNFVVTAVAVTLAPLTGVSEAKIAEVRADLIKLDLYFRLPPNLRVKIEYEYEGYFHANLGLILALFAATSSLRSFRILRLIFIALSFMIAFHVLFLLVSSTIVDPCVRGALPCLGQPWYRWLDRLMAVSKNLFPVLLWALLTFRYWFPKPAAPAAPPSPPPQRHPKEARP